MQLIAQLKNKAQSLLSDSRGSHDWEHTERVTTLALHLAQVEGAKSDIVHIAALLHDIARHDEDKSHGKICHAEQGAKQAIFLLKQFHCEPALIDQVAHCIQTHRFRNNHYPQSIEAKVLFDADKLDSIGAVGIGRAFLFSGEIGAKLHNGDIPLDQTTAYSVDDTAYREYMVKLRNVKSRILTKEGRRLAEERHDFMVQFFERLNKEVKGLL